MSHDQEATMPAGTPSRVAPHPRPVRRSSSKLLAALALLAAGALGLGPARPALAQYPPQEPTCELSEFAHSPGDPLTVSGENWLPGGTVRVTLRPGGESLGAAGVRDDGAFSLIVVIPPEADDGPHALTCTGGAGAGRPANVSSIMAVAAVWDSRVGPGAPLSDSGISVGAMALVGLIVLALLVRRRREEAEARA